MTKQQFEVVAGLLGLTPPDRRDASEVIFDGAQASETTECIVVKLRQADAAIRGAYVFFAQFSIVAARIGLGPHLGSIHIQGQ